MDGGAEPHVGFASIDAVDFLSRRVPRKVVAIASAARAYLENRPPGKFHTRHNVFDQIQVVLVTLVRWRDP